MGFSKGSEKALRRAMRVAPLLAVILLLAGSGPASAFPLWGDTSVGVTQFHQVIMMQGDDPSSTEVEPRDQVLVLDRAFWSIPWNSTEVYTYISPYARNVSMDNIKSVSHQGSSVFVPGDFSRAVNPDDPPASGWVVEDGYEGYFYWRFPEGVSRDVLHTLEVHRSIRVSTEFGDDGRICFGLGSELHSQVLPYGIEKFISERLRQSELSSVVLDRGHVHRLDV